MNFDTVISGGTIIDGTGRPGFVANVGIQDGKVAAIAPPAEQLEGISTIDATGLVVAPGFIDVHSHFDWNLPLPDHDQTLASVVLQGVTTVVTGNCGSSPAPVNARSLPLLASRLGAYGVDSPDNGDSYFRWHSMAEYLDTLENAGVLLNIAPLVGHGAIRDAVMGRRPGEPSQEELVELCRLTRQSLREGAFGFSAGLGYEPGMYAGTQELLPLLSVTAEEGCCYTVHSRSYSVVSPLYPVDLETPHNIISTREQLDLATQTGVRLQLSHLLFHGRRTWPTYRTVIGDVERAAAAGLDVGFDSFPYTFGNTTVNVNFPKWFLMEAATNLNDRSALRRLESEMNHRHEALGRGFDDIILMYGAVSSLSELEGLNFTEIALQLGLSAFEGYMHVARASEGRARILQDTYSGDSEQEEPLRAIISHPLCAFMTDTLIFPEGYPNRATFGTFPRFLGHYSRDLGLFSLEEAVRKMTSLAAERIGLAGVGRIAEGNSADLVVFDPDTVADKTTFQRPDAPPSGIEAVLISGCLVAEHGKMLAGERRGRVMRR